MEALALTHENIVELLQDISKRLEEKEVRGEILVLGGSAFVLAFKSRVATRDVDAIFEPKDRIYEAARNIAAERSLPEDWLNDAVKGFASSQGESELYLDLPALRVFLPAPAYMFAMKALSMRISPESRDVEDLRFLLKLLNLRDVGQAIALISKYYPEDRIPPKTSLALEELLQQALS